MDKNVNMFPTDPPEQVTREGLDQSSFLINQTLFMLGKPQVHCSFGSYLTY